AAGDGQAMRDGGTYVNFTGRRTRVMSRVYLGTVELLSTTLLCVALAACGGSSKPAATTPKAAGSGSGSASQSMQDTGTPDVAANGGGDANPTGGGGGSNANATPAPADTGPPEPQIIFPNQDPDPTQVKAQVDQHLNIARSALSAPTPDADTAL